LKFNTLEQNFIQLNSAWHLVVKPVFKFVHFFSQNGTFVSKKQNTFTISLFLDQRKKVY